MENSKTYGSVVRKTGSRTETGQVVGSLVDGSDSESVLVARLLDEVENTVDSLETVVKVGGVVEPVVVEESLANVEVVDTTRK